MNELGIIVLMIVVWFPRIYQEMVRVAAMPLFFQVILVRVSLIGL